MFGLRRRWIILLAALALFVVFTIVLAFFAGVGGVLWFMSRGEGRSAGEASPGEDYGFGSVRSFDADGDGKSDRYTLKYGREEVAESLFLDRSVEYRKEAGGDFKGVMRLRFENTGSPRRFRHSEVISKEFASDVRFLKFSVQPSEIVNPDPNVTFDGYFDKATEVTIESSEKKKPGEVAGALEDQLVEKGLERCQGMKDAEDQAVCALNLISQYRKNKRLKDEVLPADTNLLTLDGALPYAVYNKDFKYCWQLPDKSQGAICYQYALGALLTECERMGGDGKAECMRGLWWKVPNDDARDLACEQIADDGLRKECLGEAGVSVCKGIGDRTLRDKCIVNVGRKRMDLKVCDEITDKELKDWCVYNVGVRKSDPAVCEKIQDAEERDDCIAKIAGDKMALGLCDKIADADKKNVCLGMIAIMTNSTSLELCERITLTDDEDEYDPETFSYKPVKDSLMRDMCFMNYAVQTDFADRDICEKKISNKENRDLCYLTMAAILNDPDICDKIDEEYVKQNCLHVLAKLTGDKALCDEISSKKQRETCGKAVEEAEPVTAVEDYGGFSIEPSYVEGETGVRYNFTLKGSLPKQDYKVVWDWGDGNKAEHIKRYTHQYWNESSYTITAKIYDTVGDRLIGEASARANIKYPYTPLDLLHMCDDVYVSVNGNQTYSDSDGVRNHRFGGYSWQTYPSTLVWTGRSFSSINTREPIPSSHYHYTVEISGSVSQNGSVLEWFTGKFEELDQKTGKTRYYTVRVTNVPLNSTYRTLPVVRQTTLTPKFVGYQKGASINVKVPFFDWEEPYPTKDKPDYQYKLQSIDWNAQGKKPYIEVIFKKGRVDQYDTPSYYDRD